MQWCTKKLRRQREVENCKELEGSRMAEDFGQEVCLMDVVQPRLQGEREGIKSSVVKEKKEEGAQNSNYKKRGRVITT